MAAVGIVFMQAIRKGYVSKLSTRLLLGIVLFILLLSVLRGIRFPSNWSYCHFLFNYEFGFVHRGLVGSFFNIFDAPLFQSYDFFLIFSLSVLAINIWLLVGLLKNIVDRHDLLLLACALIYVSSTGVIFLSHSIGYSDLIGLLFTLISLRLTGFYNKYAFVLLTFPVLLLIHEALLIIFYPTICMSIFFAIEKNKIKTQLPLLALLSIVVLVVGLLLNNAILDKEKVALMQTELQDKVEFSLRSDTFDVLYKNSEENLEIMKKRWTELDRYLSMGLSLIVTAPAIVFFNYVSARLLNSAGIHRGIVVFSVLAGISPLVLHIVAWDLDRWNTLTVTTSFLMLSVIAEYANKSVTIKNTQIVYPLVFCLVYLNGTSTIPLFDGYAVKNFPFREHLSYLKDVALGVETFPATPRD